MSGTDYAAELLGSRAAPPPGGTDYAADLLGPQKTFSQNLADRKAELTGTAGFGALTKAGMVDDPKTKMRLLAADLFPGDPAAVERFGVLGGDIVYVGKDDKLYKAEPGGALGAPVAFAANMLGNAPTVIGGTAGAIVGAPAGPMASAGLAAIGAAGGKGIQESLANLALDEPQTAGGNVAGMAKEAAFAGAGGLIGAGLQGWLQRNMARDITKFDPAKVADLDAKAQKFGVTRMNVAQRTGVPSLRGKAEALARIPESADEMNAALQATRSQADDAAERFVASISKTDGLDEAGAMARDAAKKVISKLTAERAAVARPLYDEAFKDTLQSTPQLRELMARPSMQMALRKAQTLAANEGIPLQLGKDLPARTAFVGGKTETVAAGHGTKTVQLPGMLDASGAPLTRELPAETSQFSLKGLHYVKLALGDMIDGAPMKGSGPTLQRSLIGLKNDLVGIMDSASPAYKQARETFAHFSPNIASVKDGVLSRIADLSDEKALEASRLMFNPRMSPTAIQRAKNLFLKAGLKDDWNAMLRGYLQDTLETAGREFKSGPGAGKAVTWRYQMFGDPKQRANLQAAMTPQQYQTLGEMMDVFEAVNRVQGTGNSITMPMQEAARQIRQDAGSGALGKIAGMASPQNIGQGIKDWLTEVRLGNHAEKLAKVINDPQGLKKLSELRRLSPTDQKFIQGFTTLFGVSSSPE